MSREKKCVAIVGLGYVGQAVEKLLESQCKIYRVDPSCYVRLAEGASFEQLKERANENCELAFVCVPTESLAGGAADISIVEETVKWLETPIICIKSTVPPCTTARLRAETGKRIIFNPEYIGEGNYPVPDDWPHPTDMSKHTFQIFGGERSDCHVAAELFKKLLGPNCRIKYTDATTAELVKYMENSYFATKVTFCQQFFDLAESLDVDYDELRELWLLDGRIGSSHTAVFREHRGYGGKCLPKDTKAISAVARARGCTMSLLDAVEHYNKELRTKLGLPLK